MTQAAFPSPGVVLPNGRQQGAYEGMSLRDYAAIHMDDSNMGEVLVPYLTDEVKVELAGRPCPQPSDELRRGMIGAPDEISYHIDMLKWIYEVRAGLRYMMADAMMVQRERM